MLDKLKTVLPVIEARCAQDGVVVTDIRSPDIMDRWIIVEGVCKAFHRVYVVFTMAGVIAEVPAGYKMSDDEIIEYHMPKTKPTLSVVR